MTTDRESRSELVENVLAGVIVLTFFLSVWVFINVDFFRAPALRVGGFVNGQMRSVEFVETGSWFHPGATYVNSIALESGETVSVEMPVLPADGERVCLRQMIDSETHLTASYLLVNRGHCAN